MYIFLQTIKISIGKYVDTFTQAVVAKYVTTKACTAVSVHLLYHFATRASIIVSAYFINGHFSNGHLVTIYIKQ